MTKDMSNDTTKNTEGGTHETTHNWMFVGLILAVIGIGLSIYSTMHHLEVKATGKTDAACNINDTFSCDEVALSKYSEIAGVPLGVFGLGYFLAALILLVIGLRGGKPAKEHLHGYIAMVTVGVVVSATLGTISATALGAYCLTCIGVYVLTGLQAATLLVWRKDLPGNFSIKNTLSGATTGVIAVATVVLVFNFTKSSLVSKTTESNAALNKDLPALSATVEVIPISKSAYSGLGEDYRKGNDNAKVVITEFADFQCPACARISETLGTISKEYGDRVLLVFRNYPLDSACNSAVQAKIHENACNAAILARCAGQAGKFWQFHDMAFGLQKDLSPNSMRQWGQQLGLSDEQMTTCLASKDMLAKIQEDVSLGNKLGVDSTPTIFVNGRKVLGGKGISELRTEIDQLLD